MVRALRVRLERQPMGPSHLSLSVIYAELAAVYRRFTEGFESPDLVSANRLLSNAS